MSHHDVQVRLRHMLDAARKAAEFCRNKTRADLGEDAMLALALTRLLEIIGEAAKHVPSNFRDKAPAIPWRDITGTRDRLTHAYMDVDMDIVWTIISESLPRLISELEKLVPPEGRGSGVGGGAAPI